MDDIVGNTRGSEGGESVVDLERKLKRELRELAA